MDSLKIWEHIEYLQNGTEKESRKALFFVIILSAQEAVPALAAVGFRDLPTGGGQSVSHFGGPVIDDTGGEEQSARFEERTYLGCKADNDVRYDVGADDVVVRAELGL